MRLELPEDCRPRGVYYHQCELGVDLPRGFYDDISAIDENLYPVWHAFSVLWEQIVMNADAGEVEDPRYEINSKFGELNFGYPVMQSQEDRPLSAPNIQGGGLWHLWRLSRPHGWCHVVALESKEPEYLKMVAFRLHLQATYNDKYGHNGYGKYLETLDQEQREREMRDHESMMGDIQDANGWFMKKAMENMERGHTAPTNPQKESIMSYAGQENRSRVIRPLDDSDIESGLILPPGY